MSRTWVVVAHRAGARILYHGGPGCPLVLEKEIDHPEGRFQNKHIDADKQGRAFSGKTGSSSGYQQHEDPHDHVAHVFAKDLGRLLDQGRNEHAYDNVVLVAEPRFLGMLRDSLSSQTAQKVKGSVTKDLYLIPTRDLAKHLEGVLKIGNGE